MKEVFNELFGAWDLELLFGIGLAFVCIMGFLMGYVYVHQL